MAVFLTSVMAVLIDQKPRFEHDRNRDIVASENTMTSQKGPNIKKKQKCKNCEGKGLLKKGDKVVKCQRCGGTGVR
jgi:DnaJ-class molecular chaperone